MVLIGIDLSFLVYISKKENTISKNQDTKKLESYVKDKISTSFTNDHNKSINLNTDDSEQIMFSSENNDYKITHEISSNNENNCSIDEISESNLFSNSEETNKIQSDEHILSEKSASPNVSDLFIK
jgi:hypothetical protein